MALFIPTAVSTCGDFFLSTTYAPGSSLSHHDNGKPQGAGNASFGVEKALASRGS
jgi:hypothetical protein